MDTVTRDVTRDANIFLSSIRRAYTKSPRRPHHLSDLQIRLKFKSKILIRQFAKDVAKHELAKPPPRLVPNMEELVEEEIESIATSLISVYEKHLKRRGYATNQATVEASLREILLASPRCYCLHCRLVVQITPEQFCPRCRGWWLLDEQVPPDTLSAISTHLAKLNAWIVGPAAEPKPALTRDALKAIRVEPWLYRHEIKSTCHICIEKFQTGQWVSETACNHYFHHICIRTWFDKSPVMRKCPVCSLLLPTVDPLFNIYLRAKAITSHNRILPNIP